MFLNRVAATEEARETITRFLHEQNLFAAYQELAHTDSIESPYPELGCGTAFARIRLRNDIILATGRFRSGSTLLWNIFRAIPGITAYYEPFNERRWFDKEMRGSRVDSTHLNVSEYWAEYDGLDKLSKHYDEDWIRYQLYMNSTSWNYKMQRYIETLVAKAQGRPMLQFNRVDFRLPWLRARFPNAAVIHIFRHPRDQWCSSLLNTRRLSKDMDLRDFASCDGFYLLTWGRDLRRYFPFLTLDETAHPYELFYQIWKLSYIFGRKYADLSISFEELVKHPRRGLQVLLKTLSIDGVDPARLATLVKPVRIGKWIEYADEGWFSAIESRVDATLADYFQTALTAEPNANSRKNGTDTR